MAFNKYNEFNFKKTFYVMIKKITSLLYHSVVQFCHRGIRTNSSRRLIATGVFILSFWSGSAQYTTIPDANFEAALEALGYDDVSGDGQVPTALIEVVTSINLSDQSITNLTGLEDFIALETLVATGNNFTSINLSQNTELSGLSIWGNALDNIDLSNNTKLTSLILSSNNLTALDISNNVLLQEFYISNNPIQSIDLSGSNNLIGFEAKNCNLSTLNIANGTNTNISYFDTTGNSDLYCILVDDASYSATNWTNIDIQASFSDTYCRYTAIPDSNFEAKLEALGYDDISGDGQVPTKLIENITSVNLRNSNINDATGIEDFTALKTLILDSNNLTEIDVSNNIALERLELNGNNLLELDVSQNINLTILDLDNNDISEINLSTNVVIEELDLSRNNIATIDLSTLVSLKDLEIDDNPLSSLDVSANTLLEYIEASKTELLSIDLSNNTLLTEIVIENCTTIESIDISGLTLLVNLYLNKSPITALDTSDNAALRYIGIEDNTVITSLDLTNNTIIDALELTNAVALTHITFGNNTLLSEIEADNTGLNSIDASTLIGLEDLEIQDTMIEVLDLTNNINLERLNASNSNLSLLNIKNGNNSIITGFDTTNNPNLICIQVDDATYSTTNWTNIDVQTSFSTTSCDTTAPVITLLGVDPVVVEFGSTYLDGGATASDNYDGDLTTAIVVVNPVDTSVLGDYTITYNVSDAAGNAATQVTRTVSIVDTTAPVITLLGDNPQTIEKGEAYIELGGITDDGSAITIDASAVDTNTAGSYTVTYGAADASGNVATPVTRTVNVLESCPIFDLPADNFVIQAVTETCEDKDNGMIFINAAQELNYMVTVNNESYAFSDQLLVSNLAPGTYPLCIAIDGYTDCELCYELVIEEAPVLAGKTTMSTDVESSKVFVEIASGTAPFTAMINDEVVGSYTTDSFYVDVQHGDTLEVLSSVACEGKLSKAISLFDQVTAYPNPTTSSITLRIPSFTKTTLAIDVRNALGVLVVSKAYSVVDGSIVLPMDQLSAGIYFLTISGDLSSTLRIVKN